MSRNATKDQEAMETQAKEANGTEPGADKKVSSQPPQGGADGVLTHTPDTGADEGRDKLGPLDFDEAGPFSDEPAESASVSVFGQPSDLYGKFTWKIENFSEINKRELRSNIFEVGSFKWYILIYPQGCDVCNHLSLFLCVADYDRLLPGWSHFAQFTIAVVNRDPKKSKYSDTLHRFCKKEHDWGWKKFMELSKVSEGFTVANTLVIKAQVQVIHEKPHRPFRCLDAQYRRELVRVYLTNVEGICRRFIEEKQEKLSSLVSDSGSINAFWTSLHSSTRHKLASDSADALLRSIVKRFFHEKEVTSTLVMDALYAGARSLEAGTRNANPQAIPNSANVANEAPPVQIDIASNIVSLTCDAMALLHWAATGFSIEQSDERDEDETQKDSVERDEWRLADLGRRTIEMGAVAHIFATKIETAYREALAYKRQEALIKEEERSNQTKANGSNSASNAGHNEHAKKSSKKAKQKKGRQSRTKGSGHAHGKENGDEDAEDADEDTHIEGSTGTGASDEQQEEANEENASNTSAGYERKGPRHSSTRQSTTSSRAAAAAAATANAASATQSIAESNAMQELQRTVDYLRERLKKSEASVEERDGRIGAMQAELSTARRERDASQSTVDAKEKELQKEKQTVSSLRQREKDIRQQRDKEQKDHQQRERELHRQIDQKEQEAKEQREQAQREREQKEKAQKEQREQAGAAANQAAQARSASLSSANGHGDAANQPSALHRHQQQQQQPVQQSQQQPPAPHPPARSPQREQQQLKDTHGYAQAQSQRQQARRGSNAPTQSTSSSNAPGWLQAAPPQQVNGRQMGTSTTQAASSAEASQLDSANPPTSSHQAGLSAPPLASAASARRNMTKSAETSSMPGHAAHNQSPPPLKHKHSQDTLNSYKNAAAGMKAPPPFPDADSSLASASHHLHAGGGNFNFPQAGSGGTSDAGAHLPFFSTSPSATSPSSSRPVNANDAFSAYDEEDPRHISAIESLLD